VGELFGMWSNTRMVVLTAISAALYAAILIPFKVVPLIPGITEFRPANAIPVVLSFLFGPAAAWGAAFGNLIGDFFGGLGPGDFFGFLGNLCYGFVPYAVWQALTDAPPVTETPRALPRGIGWAAAGAALLVAVLASRLGLGAVNAIGIGLLVGGVIVAVRVTRAGLLATFALASALCATIVGWGLQLLGFHPFTVLGTIVLMNDLVVAVALGPMLLALLYPRVERAGLLYRDILGPRVPPPRWRGLLGVALLTVGTTAAFAAGELIAAGRWVAPWAPYLPPTGSLAVGLGLVPFLLAAVAGLMLL
jgi:energy-coupling factor transport system substrate-specific component